MSRRNLPTGSSREAGMTLIELLIVLVITALISITFTIFFKTSFFTYLNLQKDASGFTDLATQSHRIANVVRGMTDIVAADDDEMTLYGYFFPTDTYVSLIRYYQNATGTVLYADVTPMTSNPPIGSPLPAQKKTYVIINNFKLASGVKLFQYLDSGGAVMPLPINDLHTVKGVQINLAVATEVANGNQAMTLEISLRNRKTNL